MWRVISQDLLLLQELEPSLASRSTLHIYYSVSLFTAAPHSHSAFQVHVFLEVKITEQEAENTLVAESTGAPLSRSSWTRSMWPSLAARCKALRPFWKAMEAWFNVHLQNLGVNGFKKAWLWRLLQYQRASLRSVYCFPSCFQAKVKKEGNVPWTAIHIPRNTDPTVLSPQSGSLLWQASTKRSFSATTQPRMWQPSYRSPPQAAEWIPVEPSDGIPKGAHICSGITGPCFDFHFPVVLLCWLLFSHVITLLLISYCVITTSIVIKNSANMVFPLSFLCMLSFYVPVILLKELNWPNGE